MSESVVTRFKAKDDLSSTVKTMGKNTKRFSKETQKEFTKLTRKSNKFFKSFGKSILAGVGIGSGIAAFQKFSSVVRESIAIGIDFEQSVVNAVAKFPGAIERGSQAFKDLNKVARQVGKETVFTANQAAQGLEFLAMAGFNANQAIALLPQTVNLAVAANMDLARSTDIASDVLGQFNLITEDSVQLGKNLVRVNDVLAKTVTTSNTNMEQLFESFIDAAPVAKSLGAEIETLSALTGIMASSGIKGSKSGTTLKNVFTRLINPAGQAATMISDLGVVTTDAKGNFRDILDILGDFEKGLSKLGTAERLKALDEIFGRRAIAGINVLLTEGTENIKKYRDELRDSAGASKRMADVIQSTVGASLKTLRSAAESVVISLFEIGKGTFQSSINGLTSIVRKVDDWIIANDKILKEQFTLFVDLIKEIVTSFDATAIKNFFLEAKDGASDFVTVLKAMTKLLSFSVKSVKVIKQAGQIAGVPIATIRKAGSKAPGFLRSKLFGGQNNEIGKNKREELATNFEESAPQQEKRIKSSLAINFANKPDDVSVESDILDPSIKLDLGASR